MKNNYQYSIKFKIRLSEAPSTTIKNPLKKNVAKRHVET